MKSVSDCTSTHGEVRPMVVAVVRSGPCQNRLPFSDSRWKACICWERRDEVQTVACPSTLSVLELPRDSSVLTRALNVAVFAEVGSEGSLNVTVRPARGSGLVVSISLSGSRAVAVWEGASAGKDRVLPPGSAK